MTDCFAILARQSFPVVDSTFAWQKTAVEMPSGSANNNNILRSMRPVRGECPPVPQYGGSGPEEKVGEAREWSFRTMGKILRTSP